jgi:hypothetical protein
MKRLKFRILLFGMLPLMATLCSCVKDTDSVTGGGTAPLFIRSVSAPGVNTRSTTVMSDGTLGVFRLADSDAGLAASANNLYTGTSGNWVATNGNVITAGTTSVCAYSPYYGSYSDATQLPLTAWMGLTTDTPSNELLYALPTKASSVSGNTSFTLNRAYTMLRFTLSGFSTLGGTNLVSSFSIYNKNLPASSSVNITGTSAAYGAITKQSTYEMTCTVNKLLSETPVIDVLLPPCTLYDESNTTLDVTITVDGTDRQISLDLVANNINGALADGNIYPVNLKLDNGQQPESNSYIVAPGSTIYIPVSRATAGNVANFPSGSSFTTGLLWSDVSATHVTATTTGRFIKVTAGSTEGNSVVYAKNTAGDIVWSWHIWVTDYVPNTTTINYNGKVWMDRNLGAKTNGTTSTAYGLYYQWGRKDPFPGGVNDATTMPTTSGSYPATVSSTTTPVPLETAIRNPNIFYKIAADPFDWLTPQDNTLWDNSGKTVYDPCPAGWRVPLDTEFRVVFPDNTLSGFWRYGGTFSSAASSGKWWLGVPENNANACGLGSNGDVGNSPRTSGFSVRCVKN